MLRSREKSISREKTVLPLRIFCLFHYTGILQRLQHLIIQFPLYYLLVVAFGMLKAKENFKLLALKVVAVAYERWSLTRGFQCSDLTEKLLVFWKTDRWGEMGATRGSTVVYFLQICLFTETFSRTTAIHQGILRCGDYELIVSLRG